MAVILAILKGIGVLILILIGLVLFVAALVLFVPIVYRLSGQNRFGAVYEFRVSWLAGAVAVQKNMDSDQIWFRIFGFPIRCLYQKEEQRKQRTGTQKNEYLAELERQKGQAHAPVEHTKQTQEIKQEKTKKREKKKENKKREKKSFSFDRVFSIIKLLQKPDSKQIIRRVLSECRWLLKYLAPKKIRGSIVLGTGDPGSTGLLLGLMSLFPVLYTKDVRVRPDFEEKVLLAEGMIRGWIQTFPLLLLAVRIYRDKEILGLWNQLKQTMKEAA